MKCERTQCNNKIKPDTIGRQTRKYCSNQCKNKVYNNKRNQYGKYEPGKVKCLICGRWYHKLGSHVSRSHNVPVEEYKAEFGMLPADRLSSPQTIENHRAVVDRNPHTIEKNLKDKGRGTRYKKGDPRTRWHRTDQHAKRLSDIKKKQHKQKVFPIDRLGDEYITVRQYAEREGLTAQAVYYRIEEGKVEAIKIGKHYIIKKDQ